MTNVKWLACIACSTTPFDGYQNARRTACALTRTTRACRYPDDAARAAGAARRAGLHVARAYIAPGEVVLRAARGRVGGGGGGRGERRRRGDLDAGVAGGLERPARVAAVHPGGMPRRASTCCAAGHATRPATGSRWIRPGTSAATPTTWSSASRCRRRVIEVRRIAADSLDALALVDAMWREVQEAYPRIPGATTPSATPADFSPPGGCFVALYEDGRAVAGGGVKRLEDGVGRSSACTSYRTRGPAASRETARGARGRRARPRLRAAPAGHRGQAAACRGPVPLAGYRRSATTTPTTTRRSGARSR